MRNTAKNGCQTNYTLTPDIDMVPNVGLDVQLDAFLDRVENCDESYDAYESDDCDMCDKCAFVVPVYEIADDDAGRFPANKTELLDYIRANKAREFHKVSPAAKFSMLWKTGFRGSGFFDVSLAGLLNV